MQQQQNGPSHFTREKRVKVMRKGGGGGGGSEVRVAERGGAVASRAREKRQGCSVQSQKQQNEGEAEECTGINTTPGVIKGCLP